VGKSASLATLDLFGNKIGDSGAQALGATLAATSTLTNLDLPSCGITAEGAAHLAEGMRQGPQRSKDIEIARLPGWRVAWRCWTWTRV
jgi:Ran GTPase-activating protein (RanGAP) involved in mRNA processing and transport